MNTYTNQDAISMWSSAALAHANDFGEQGDFAREHMLNPAIFAMLGDPYGKRILDAGCGQGYLCRLLAKRGASVVGIEPAEGWLQLAIAREAAAPMGITYIQEDLSSLDSQHSHLGTFDVVIANMVFMDIPDDEPAIFNCIKVLKPGGSLIFSLSHPCFEEESASWGEQGYVAVREYLREHIIPQTFASRVHRPLGHYLNLIARSGCILRQVIEPGLTAEWVQHGPQYARNHHVPNFIVIHATKAC